MRYGNRLYADNGQLVEMEARAGDLSACVAALIAFQQLPADYQSSCRTLADVRKMVEAAESKSIEQAIDEAYRVQEKRQHLINRGLAGMARMITSDDGTKQPVKPWNLEADKERNRKFNQSSPTHF